MCWVNKRITFYKYIIVKMTHRSLHSKCHNIYVDIVSILHIVYIITVKKHYKSIIWCTHIYIILINDLIW